MRPPATDRPCRPPMSMMSRGLLPAPGLAVLLLLGGCAGPCERIDRDLTRLNAEMIRNPAILTDGSYAKAFQELAAQSVEHECLR